MELSEFICLLAKVKRAVEETLHEKFTWKLGQVDDVPYLEISYWGGTVRHVFYENKLGKVSSFYLQGVVEEMVSSLIGRHFEIVQVEAPNVY